MTVIDLTHTIREDMPVYPGTEQPRLTTACTVSQCGYRETLLHMYSHTGTHMDAPAHMIDGALTLDGCGADRFVGRGYDGPAEEVIDGQGRMVMPGLVNIHTHPSSEPMNKRLYRGIREAILDGAIAADSRLPATRDLAAELGGADLALHRHQPFQVAAGAPQLFLLLFFPFLLRFSHGCPGPPPACPSAPPTRLRDRPPAPRPRRCARPSRSDAPAG